MSGPGDARPDTTQVYHRFLVAQFLRVESVDTIETPRRSHRKLSWALSFLCIRLDCRRSSFCERLIEMRDSEAFFREGAA
jgi:hypothetical protein